MPVLRFNARDFARYHAALAQRFRPAIMKGVHSGAARAVQYLTEQTRVAIAANPQGIGSGGAVNTGAFLRSWKWLPAPDGALVTNTSPYGPIIEYGRRPGATAPPLEAIVLWIRRRLGKSEAEARAMAYPIQRAIKRRGLVARQIMTSPMSQARQIELVRMEVAHELERALNQRP